MNFERNFDNKMVYPQDFINRCFRFYPNNPDIMLYISKNSYLLGRVLKSLIPEETNGDSTNAKVIDRVRKQKLYDEFVSLYEQQYLSRGKYIDEESGLVYYNPKVKKDYELKHGINSQTSNMTPNDLQKLSNNLSSGLNSNQRKRGPGNSGKFGRR